MYKKIVQKIKELETDGKEIRNFGILFAMIILATIFFYDLDRVNEKYLLILAFYFLIGVAMPSIIKYPFLAWMSFSIVLGELMFSVLFTFFYYVIILPIGVLKKMFGGDFLQMKYDKNAETYWEDYDAKRQNKESLENLF